MNEPDIKELAAELASRLGREQGDVLLDRARAHVALTSNKPGVETSEFKLSLIGVLAGFTILVLGLRYADHDLADRGLDLVQWSIAGYAIARGVAKAGAVGAGK